METEKDNMNYQSMDDCRPNPCPTKPIGHTPAMPMPNMPGTTPAMPMPMPPGCMPIMPMPGCPPMMPIKDPHYEHMKKMYYMHMHIAHTHKAEAYKHKMMYYDNCNNNDPNGNCDYC